MSPVAFEDRTVVCLDFVRSHVHFWLYVIVLGIKTSLAVAELFLSFCQVVFGLVNCSCLLLGCCGSPVEPYMDLLGCCGSQ